MDPSQLFGAWLDNRTFLGGCLEISLDRFTTTVQIEAFDVRVKIYPNECNDTFRISIFWEDVTGHDCVAVWFMSTYTISAYLRYSY